MHAYNNSKKTIDFVIILQTIPPIFDKIIIMPT